MRRPALLSMSVLLAIAAVSCARTEPTPVSPGCGSSAQPVSFSDGLDKVVADGATVGGLSNMAWDQRTRSWASTVDRHGSDPARIWFWRDPAAAKLAGAPLVLKKTDGTPYDGTTADNEGLAVLPDGDFVVSAEAEPSIRVFGRDGVQKASLPVPPRFAVEPAGQATEDATLEGLTVTPSGDRLIAAMEGALSGDTDATVHRFLIYDRDAGGTWRLTGQAAYRTLSGLSVSEVTAYGPASLLVLERSYERATGNQVFLFAVPDLTRTADVSGVADLAGHPAVAKTLIADLAKCPTLGATAKQTQPNPLLDNYEGLAVERGPGADTIHVISDDNFGANQITRVLTLTAHLP